jgi:hypothetical protein
MPLALSALSICQMGSYTYTQASLDCDSPINASPVVEMTGVCHHTQPLLIEVESCFLPGLAQTVILALCLLSSYDYRCDPLCLAPGYFLRLFSIGLFSYFLSMLIIGI